MSKIKLTGSNSGYVEISSAADAGNLTLALPTSGSVLLSNGDNVYTGITTFTNDLKLEGASYDVLWDASDNQLEFGDNTKISFGGSADLQLYHNGSNGYIKNSTGQQLYRSATHTFENAAGSSEYLRIVSDGDVGIGTNSPVERLHVHKVSATGPFMYITNTSTGVSASDGIQIGYDGTNTAVFKNNEPTDLVFYAGGQNFRITSSGHVLPATNNTQDLGSTAKGWRNVYMNDLNLSNMNGDTNDVDGTQGSWTIQEGKDDLYIINRLNGKKFKIKMEEIS